MAITKVTGGVADAPSIGAAIASAATYTMRVTTGSCATSGGVSKTSFTSRATCIDDDGTNVWTERKLELVSTDDSVEVVVSSIDLQTLYTDLGDLGE